MTEKSFMTVEEAAAELRVSKSKAYQIVRELNAEMQKYIKMLYDIKPDERLFTVTKSYLDHEMERGAKQAGLRKSVSTIFAIVRFRC